MEPAPRTRLEKRRQISVSNALANSLAAIRPTPLTATTIARAEAVVAAGQQLQAFAELTARQVNVATMHVIMGIYGVLENKERSISGTILPLNAARQQSLGRCEFLKARLFPLGTSFIRLPMDQQWGEHIRLRTALQDPEVAAALDAEGLSVSAENLLAHIALYGQVVGHDIGGAGAGEEDAQEAWNNSMHKLAAQVVIDYENDPGTRDELLGPYERQVEEQRAAARAARAARLRNTQGDADAPAPTGSAPAPTAPAPEPTPGSPTTEAALARRDAA